MRGRFWGLLVAGVLLASQGWCGHGTYNSNVNKPDDIQLLVNLEFGNQANPPDPEAWKPLFIEASKLLFDATERQIKISQVTFYNNCREMSDRADIRILPGDEMSADAKLDGLERDALSIHLSQIHKRVKESGDSGARGEVGLVHELGHYLFSLLEEYKDQSGADSDCVAPSPDGRIDTAASIMAAGTTTAKRNQRAKFCVAWNHNKGKTEQDLPRKIGSDTFSNTDDWTWIVAKMKDRFGVTLTPPAGVPTTNPIGFGADPVFKVASCEVDAAVGVDNSGSMSNLKGVREEDTPTLAMPVVPTLRGAPIDAVKEGADTFIRLLKREDRMAIVAVGGDVGLAPLRSMSIDNKFRSLAEIPPIQAAGKGGWVDLLRRSFGKLTKDKEDSSRAGSEVIVLLSDGGDGSTGESEIDPSLLKSIKRRGVAVYAVGVANGGAAGLLRAVSQTGGSYIFSKTRAQVNAAVMALLARLQSRGVIEAQEGKIGVGETLHFRIPVDEATSKTEADFLLASSESGKALSMKVVNPKGEAVIPVAPDVGLVNGDDKRLQRYWVRRPASGEWRVNISNPGPSPREFALQVHSLAERVSVAAYAEKDVIAVGEPLILKAATTTEFSVTGAHVTARIESPDGDVTTIDLFDDGSLKHRDDRKGDGTYSNVFTDFKGSGSYNVEISVDTDNGRTVAPEEPGGPPFTSEPVERLVRKVRFSIVVQAASN